MPARARRAGLPESRWDVLRVVPLLVGSGRTGGAAGAIMVLRRLPQLHGLARRCRRSPRCSDRAAGARRPSLAAPSGASWLAMLATAPSRRRSAATTIGTGHAAVDGDADLAVAGQLEADLQVERLLDLAALQLGLAAAARLSTRWMRSLRVVQQVERLQRELDVLDRRDVERRRPAGGGRCGRASPASSPGRMRGVSTTIDVVGSPWPRRAGARRAPRRPARRPRGAPGRARRRRPRGAW